MGAENRGTDPPVEDLLFHEGYRFDFFQAVRLLERLYPARQAVGRTAKPSEEVVRFRSHVSLSFPPSAIYETTRAADGRLPAQMTVAFLGLTGLAGVLPRHYTELLLERLRRKDASLRDFLDLFNHRLISLFYRAWEKYRAPVAYERATIAGTSSASLRSDPFSRVLFHLMGMGTAGLQGRLDIADDTLLFYTGLLAQQPRSASALEGVLQDYFGVPVRVAQFVGRWWPLSEDSRSRLGKTGKNNALGKTTVAGQRVWDQQVGLKVRLGPLSFREFHRLLPTGSGWRGLLQLIRFFAGQDVEFEIGLVVKAPEVPAWRLGERGEEAPLLGWSTWLTAKQCVQNGTMLEVRLTSRKKTVSILSFRTARAV